MDSLNKYRYKYKVNRNQFVCEREPRLYPVEIVLQGVNHDQHIAELGGQDSWPNRVHPIEEQKIIVKYFYLFYLLFSGTSPVVPPVLRPHDVHLVIAEVPRLLQPALLARARHPGQVSR